MSFNVPERIADGRLPDGLEGADWRRYAGVAHQPTYDGWCRAWWGIAWVRLQAFERDAAAEADAWCSQR